MQLLLSETARMSVELPNPHLAALTDDFTFHLRIPLNQDTAKVFSDVKFVCIGGTRSRMRSTCVHIASQVYSKTVEVDNQFDHIVENDRYCCYKIGAVLCVNHGIGMPSLSIMLHEVFKLLRNARCSDVTVFRIGTCGGIGMQAGTVVITEESLDYDMKPSYHTSSYGCPIVLPATANIDLINDIKAVAARDPALQGFPVISAKTYCCDDFYQGQGRLDGSFCDKTEADKQAFLTRLFDNGVRNIEMESSGVLALTRKVGIKAAVVCVTLVDRLKSDLIEARPEQIEAWEQLPIRLVTRFILSKLQK